MVEIIVAHIVHTLIGLHQRVTLLAAVLSLPGFGIRQQLIEIHTKQFGRCFASAFLTDETCTQLFGNAGIVG